MDTHGGQTASRSFVLVGAPRILGEEHAVRRAHGAFHMHQRTHGAVIDQLFGFRDRRVEPAVEPDGADDARILARGNSRFGISRGQGDRLFTEDVFAGSSCRLDLTQMGRMRCRQNNRVDRIITQQIIIIVDEGDAFSVGEFLRLGLGARHAMGKLDHIGLILDRIHQDLTPPTKTDNCCIDHSFPHYP